MTDLVPLGDRGYLARFECEDVAVRWAAAVVGRGWTGVVDVVPAYRSVGVLADPDLVDLADLADRLGRLEPLEPADVASRLIRIPVLYDGDDLAEVGGRLGLSAAEVVAFHTGTEYRVFAIGFQPGFPYAGYLPARLAGLPRRTSPRTHVAAGSVAVVGRQTAVYPCASPGGWHVIGRTPLTIADVMDQYFPIRAGDRLTFQAVGPDDFEARAGGRL